MNTTPEQAFADFRKLLIEDRTVRRFDHSRKISEDTLEKLVELTRYCASGRNAQPLRYRLVSDEESLASVYPLLNWAGYYEDWDGPEPQERPSAYLIQCIDTEIATKILADDGIQMQALTLGARTLGIGSCIIKSFNAPALAEVLAIPERFQPHYVIALGYPEEFPILVDMKPEDSFKYFRDSEGRHHVPKRLAEDLIIK